MDDGRRCFLREQACEKMMETWQCLELQGLQDVRIRELGMADGQQSSGVDGDGEEEGERHGKRRRIWITLVRCHVAS